MGHYRTLAARAKHDAKAATQFNKSNLWLDSDPVEAMAILRQHPLVKPALVGTGKNEGIEFGILNGGFRSSLSFVVSCLAKLSVKEGSGEAAGRLHRYLVAATNRCVPAQEITVFHGLVVGRRVDLGRGAYLAPYELARREFDLPDEPEPFPKKSYPNAAVLVRGLEYGPGIGRFEEEPGLPDVQIGYRFPTDYRIDLEAWFEDSKLLVDLLSIAAGDARAWRVRRRAGRGTQSCPPHSHCPAKPQCPGAVGGRAREPDDTAGGVVVGQGFLGARVTARHESYRF